MRILIRLDLCKIVLLVLLWFLQALTDNSSLAFVRPKWVFECHRQQQCVSHYSFEVAPR